MKFILIVAAALAGGIALSQPTLANDYDDHGPNSYAVTAKSNCVLQKKPRAYRQSVCVNSNNKRMFVGTVAADTINGTLIVPPHVLKRCAGLEGCEIVKARGPGLFRVPEHIGITVNSSQSTYYYSQEVLTPRYEGLTMVATMSSRNGETPVAFTAPIRDLGDGNFIIMKEDLPGVLTASKRSRRYQPISNIFGAAIINESGSLVAFVHGVSRGDEAFALQIRSAEKENIHA